MDRNPPDGTGPVHVPLGHVVANEKWRGSQLAQGMQGRWAALCINPLCPHPTFKKRSTNCYLFHSNLFFCLHFKGKLNLFLRMA